MTRRRDGLNLFALFIVSLVFSVVALAVGVPIGYGLVHG